MSSLVCICMCTSVLERNVPGSFLLYFHIMSLCRSKGDGSPVCTNRRPCVKLLSMRDTPKECNHHIKKALFFLSVFQLRSWWNQISLLVRLINHEENSQNEELLHLTVKLATSPSDQRAPKWPWPYTDFGRVVGSVAWCAPQQKPARFICSKLHSGTHGQWHVWVATRKYSYLRESTSTCERQ